MKKDTDALRKELEQEAPLLAHLKDEPDGLSVPDGYFARLREDVMRRIAEEKTTPVRKLPRVWYRLAAAASVILLASVAFFLFRPGKPAPQEEQAAITAEELHEYIFGNIDDFELDILIRFAGNDTGHSGWFDGANPDDPELQKYMDELLDDIDLETLEELL